MKEQQKPIIFPTGAGFLPGAAAAVVLSDFQKISYQDQPVRVKIKGEHEYRNVVPWGDYNNLPGVIISRVEKSPDLSTGILFNIQIIFGEGIVACRYKTDSKGNKIEMPVYDHPEINEFFENNDINKYLLEQITDLNYFYNIFPEIILNQEEPARRKVLSLSNKEAAFSRWEQMNQKTGKIENHFYSAQWPDGIPGEDQLQITEVLDPLNPVNDILRRIGRLPRMNGKIIDDGVFRYIIPVNFPTPGKFYYQKPYWYSIFESGWYDFAVAIPEFKKYLLRNGMNIKYIIRLSDDYFPDIFAKEGIRDEAGKKARIEKEYQDMNDYLTGLKNTGKSMISFFKNNPAGNKQYRIEIEDISNRAGGGEYIEDSGEVSAMIAYTMGVHPSLIGAVPGKNSNTFSGTDKRELFIIKQSLIKPIRQLLLRPLYLIKKVNNWPEDIHFTIPDIVFKPAATYGTERIIINKNT